MTRIPLLGALAIAAAAAPVHADVTFTRKNDGRMAAGSLAGVSVQQVKGARMREDTTAGQGRTSTILDATRGRLISLNHARREAEVFDVASLQADLAKIPLGDVKAVITPTAETRKVGGHACTVHSMSVTVPMELGGESVRFAMSGPVCLSTSAPGRADISSFYKAALEKGFFFGDPRSAKAQPGIVRAMTALHREMAARGVPLAQELKMTFEGSGPMASMMAKMGGTTMTSEVETISTEPIPDSAFEIPADYKVITR